MDGDAGAGGEAAGTGDGTAGGEVTGVNDSPGGVDYAWVMQVTFVVTVAVGAPLVAALSLSVALPTWAEKAGFAVRVGAAVWLVTALAVYGYARRRA